MTEVRTIFPIVLLLICRLPATWLRCVDVRATLKGAVPLISKLQIDILFATALATWHRRRREWCRAVECESAEFHCQLASQQMTFTTRARALVVVAQ